MPETVRSLRMGPVVAVLSGRCGWRAEVERRVRDTTARPGRLQEGMVRAGPGLPDATGRARHAGQGRHDRHRTPARRSHTPERYRCHVPPTTHRTASPDPADPARSCARRTSATTHPTSVTRTSGSAPRHRSTATPMPSSNATSIRPGSRCTSSTIAHTCAHDTVAAIARSTRPSASSTAPNPGTADATSTAQPPSTSSAPASAGGSAPAGSGAVNDPACRAGRLDRGYGQSRCSWANERARSSVGSSGCQATRSWV